MQFNNSIIGQEAEGSAGGDQNLQADQVMLIKCECCGMAEDFTPNYVSRVREFFFGRWICGLCSEAVKEKKRKRKISLEEALDRHMEICMKFNMKRRSYRTEAFIGWGYERDCKEEFTVQE
ncbi:hypothetical protein IEQ34_017989 [Dendrobium chrysotoxum]|uniref:Uncharacterized protein n=1 Tax=Dendrobium chrysotoxum TaxID=161865 RepID=A0AAV7GD73_DENCH|nr:hypothetical protein IEQ34_017989 [Dendrobium chrysotoxum]